MKKFVTLPPQQKMIWIFLAVCFCTYEKLYSSPNTIHEDYDIKCTTNALYFFPKGFQQKMLLLLKSKEDGNSAFYKNYFPKVTNLQ